MRRLVTAMMMLTLVLSAIVLVARLVSPAIASAPAPLPPDHPVSHSPARSADESTQEMLPPPSPHEASREIQEARARSAIEEVLQKHSRYWGPRYQVEPVQVSVDGEWAHGVAQWQDEAEAMGGSVHVLARRSESGAWQALMPSAEELYRKWVDEVPESLVPAFEKDQLRAQAVETGAWRIRQVTPVVASGVTPVPSRGHRDENPVQSVSGLVQPRATPTPVSILDQAMPCRSAEPGPQLPAEIEARIRAAVQAELDVSSTSQGSELHWSIVSVWGQNDWAVVECDVRTEDGAPVATEGRVVLVRYVDGSWMIAVPGSQEYEAWLSQIPDDYLSPDAKRFVEKWQILGTSDAAPQAQSSSRYRLPFPNGTQVYVKQDSDAHGGPVDIIGLDNSTMVAARDGWIRAVEDSYWQCCCSVGCSACNNYVVMEHSDGEWTKYFHIAQGSAQNAKNNVNNWIAAGTVLAVQGDTGYTCGSDRLGTGCDGHIGSSCGIHLHFEVRDGRYGAYRTPRFCGVPGESAETDQTYEATDCGGGTCPAPNLVSPAWGYVHPDSTVTFRWDPVDCPGQNGYLLRIGTSPDGSDVVSDRLSLGIQTNVTISSQWHNRHLYWSVRANASGAPWSGSRRFRIELGSGDDCPLFSKGDANCDGCVDELDYVVWWKSYEKDVRADFNGDGITDDLDYVIWWKNFGEGCQGG